MLEYKRIYEQVANTYIKDDWKNMDKNELCFKCCEFEGKDNKMYEAYLCAIIVRYWSLIGANYRQGKGAYSESECYDWLIDSINGTLSTKSWLNPESSLYNDKLAPDKSINVRMKSHRQGFYQWSNCKKRAGDYTINNSLESLFESAGDAAFPSIVDDELETRLDINNYIKSEFKNKNYVTSFLLYNIIRGDVFDKKRGSDGVVFNKKKLYLLVRKVDNRFKDEFVKSYNVDRKDVDEAILSCNKLSRRRLYTLIDKSMEKLYKNFEYLQNA